MACLPPSVRMGAALQEFTVPPLFVQVCCSMTSDYETCWCRFGSLVLFRAMPNSEQRQTVWFPAWLRSMLRGSPSPACPSSVYWKAEGHSQRLFLDLLWFVGWQPVFPRCGSAPTNSAERHLWASHFCYSFSCSNEDVMRKIIHCRGPQASTEPSGLMFITRGWTL